MYVDLQHCCHQQNVLLMLAGVSDCGVLPGCLVCCCQVWIKYKRSHMYPQQHRIAKPAANVLDLLAMPAITALPSRSSSAWWNRPVMWQPQQHQAWASFKPGYDPLTATWARQQQQLQQPAQQAPAALEGDSSSNRGVSD
jgi:hypothetical protein